VSCAACDRSGGAGAESVGDGIERGESIRGIFTTNDAGEVEIKTLAYGIYLAQAEKAGFTPITEMVEVRSAVPTERELKMSVAPVTTSVEVRGSAPLIDPYRPSSMMHIGSQQIEDRVGRCRAVGAGFGELATGLAV